MVLLFRGEDSLKENIATVYGPQVYALLLFTTEMAIDISNFSRYKIVGSAKSFGLFLNSQSVFTYLPKCGFLSPLPLSFRNWFLLVGHCLPQNHHLIQTDPSVKPLVLVRQ